MTNRKTRRLIQNIFVLTVLALGLWWIAAEFIKFNVTTFTDNAQVRRQIVPINARVQGYIKEIRFDEYSYVHKDDTLIIIDDAEYALALAQANAQVQNALAGKSTVNASITTTASEISVNDASIEGTRIEMENALRDVERYQALLNDKAVTPKQYDDAHTKYESLKAKYEMLCRQKQSTMLTRDEKSQQLGQHDAGIELARAGVELARLNLSYTVITAPVDGYTSRRNLQVGQLVQPGQTLLSIVDENDVWVIANYKESQTSKMKIGDKVKVTVDAIPDKTYIGVIEAISNATGAQYSLVPQDNATGNFVKVEQRLPVKIRFTKDNSAADMRLLRAGLNVECELMD
jgi:membrane fusion protein (multidrug efflux system)